MKNSILEYTMYLYKYLKHKMVKFRFFFCEWIGLISLVWLTCYAFQSKLFQLLSSMGKEFEVRQNRIICYVKSMQAM